MKELFRLRIAAKRQMTIPQRLMNILNLVEGDELQITVEDKRITDVVPYTSIPAHLITPEVAAAIEESRKGNKAGDNGDANAMAERMHKARVKTRRPAIEEEPAIAGARTSGSIRSR